MDSTFISLESIEIARPCRANWNAMTGDERARFCQSCKKNVYDFSAMTRDEAMHLIEEKEGNLCVRLHRRADGTVLTSDCPVGEMQPKRAPWMRTFMAVTGFVVGMVGLRSSFASNTNDVMVTAGVPVFVPTPTPVPATTPKKTQTKTSRIHTSIKHKTKKIQHKPTSGQTR
ncbi:hypothetical protein IAD21_03885 [Abditibacteriota bacterium]|nr:hypothetical protein IAD21_03885 [Abditibacteriota bacterium]